MRIPIPFPAAPGNAATIQLFTTHNKKVGSTALSGPGPSVRALDKERLHALEFVWLLNDQAGAANGIRVYALGSTNVWVEVDVKDDLAAATVGSAAPQTVPVLAAGQERRWLLDCSRYRGVTVEYTAGATGPTPTTGWDGVFTAHTDVEALIR